MSQKGNQVRYFIISLFFSILSMPAIAVDGYKSLKFGIAKDEVKESKICNFTINIPLDTNAEGIGCTDFMFSGDKTVASAIFIDNKFVRFVIDVPGKKVDSVITALNQKYGPPSTPASQDGMKELLARKPLARVQAGFDKDTVLVEMMNNKVSERIYTLIYTVSDFDERKAENVKNDI